MKVISLGVGVQSTALYYMSSLGEIPRADVAIFADTGGEKTATLEYYDYLKKWQEENDGIPLYKAAYKNITDDIFSQSDKGRFISIPAFTNTGGQLKRQCTSEYKIRQCDKMIKEILGLRLKQRYPPCDIWYGISLDEMQRMRIPHQKWKTNVYPFIGYRLSYGSKSQKDGDQKYTRGDIINWYNKKGYEIPVRSCCVFCPFQSRFSWKHLYDTSPDDFQAAIKIDNTIRNVNITRGYKGLVYVHRDIKPLEAVTFDDTQLDMFDDECSGNCMI